MGQMKWKKALAAVALGGTLLLGGNAAGAEPSQDGMKAFREAYTSIVPANRVFRESISFFGPDFHADLNYQGQMLHDGALRLAGNLEWGYTDKKSGETTQLTLPFYVEQNKADMIYYGQYKGMWCKLTLPGISPQLAGVLKTTDMQALEENMNVVKTVEILQETDKQRVMKIFLDGDKVAALVEKYCVPNPGLTPQKQQRHREMVQRLERTCKASKLQVVWTVDKTKWQTVTVAINLTDFMRNYAQGLLQESAAGKINLSANQQEFLAALGYYSELHAYTTYVKDASPEHLAVPKDVRKSAQSLDIFLPGKKAVTASTAQK